MEIKHIYLKVISEYAYKNPYGMGIVTGCYMVKPSEDLEERMCFQVTYRDGFIDYIPLDYESAGYKLVSMTI